MQLIWWQKTTLVHGKTSRCNTENPSHFQGMLNVLVFMRAALKTDLSFFRSSEADAEAVALGEAKSTELSKKLAELYLRRTKEDVLANDLPKKDERIVFCEPSKLQKALYQHILAQPDFILLALANAPCDCGVNRKVGWLHSLAI